MGQLALPRARSEITTMQACRAGVGRGRTGDFRMALSQYATSASALQLPIPLGGVQTSVSLIADILDVLDCGLCAPYWRVASTAKAHKTGGAQTCSGQGSRRPTSWRKRLDAEPSRMLGRGISPAVDIRRLAEGEWEAEDVGNTSANPRKPSLASWPVIDGE